MEEDINQKPTRSWFNYFGIMIRGFCMGAADVVPGVSGGTIALLLGIYNELVEAINSVDSKFFRHLLTFRWKAAFYDLPWKFLLSLAIGILTAIITLAQILEWALSNYPVFVWSFFFGLVFASVIVVLMRAGQLNLKMLGVFFAASLGAFFLVGLRPGQTPETPVYLFLSGAIAICAMILPGISGAFILVLLGKYEFVLNAVVERDILTVLMVGMGAVVGLLSFARLLKWLLNRYYAVTISVLAGFMLGSLRVLWPWKAATADVEHGKLENIMPAAFTAEVGIALVFMVTAFALVVFLEYISSRRFSSQRVAVQQK